MPKIPANHPQILDFTYIQGNFTHKFTEITATIKNFTLLGAITSIYSQITSNSLHNIDFHPTQ